MSRLETHLYSHAVVAFIRYYYFISQVPCSEAQSSEWEVQGELKNQIIQHLSFSTSVAHSPAILDELGSKMIQQPGVLISTNEVREPPSIGGDEVRQPMKLLVFELLTWKPKATTCFPILFTRSLPKVYN
ncbi:hypothetical protein ACJX0J_027140 [Zea mays]